MSWRRMRWLMLGLLTFWLSLAALPALGQLPPMFNSSRPVTTSNNLPLGIDRYGDLEVAPVVSPYTGDELFKIVSSTIVDRENPPADVIPVEARARDIEGRLRLVYRRIGALENPPQVDVSVLNQTPILVIASPTDSRSLSLVTVTEQDSAFYGETRRQLAQEWEDILQEDVDQVYQLHQPEIRRQRLVNGINILLGLLAFTLLVWFLRRLLNRRQNFLRLQQQEEDQARTNLIAETVASQEKQSLGVAQVAAEEPGMASAAQPERGTPDSSSDHEEAMPFLLHRHHALLVLLRQKFNTKRRIRFYTLLKWLLFWVTILVWYGGIYAIATTVPYLMRWQYWILSTPLKVLLIWFAVGLAIRISLALIDARTIKRFSTAIPTEMIANPAEEQRRELQASTITGALEGLATVGLILIGIIGTLNSFNISTESIVAGGAILGLAISFGSQSLVKDLVNGTLILLEDQFAVGDVVAIDDDAGVVENVNLRVTQIRNTQGELITIPNSSINRVKNMTRLWSRVDFAIEVAYENDINQVIALLKELAHTLYQEDPWKNLILEEPEVLGVDQVSHTGMLLRVWIKTAPMQQWAVGREYRRRVRLAFEEHNIHIGRPEWISYNTGWNSPHRNGLANAADSSTAAQ
jgi:small-conductance mechanosensitive channel